jgi:hypothetical protein
MPYAIYGDVKSSGHISTLPFLYLHKPNKYPLDFFLLVLDQSSLHDFTELVYMDILYVHVLKKKETIHIFINEIAFHDK